MVRASAVKPKPWKTGVRPVAMEIVLLKHTCVLPWSQFLYPEGTTDRIRAFATHDEVRDRITALRRRAATAPAEEPLFEYNEDEQLRLDKTATDRKHD